MGEGTLKLLDFGLAQTTATGLSVSGPRLGTPSYMSPEQARFDRLLDLVEQRRAANPTAAYCAHAES